MKKTMTVMITDEQLDSWYRGRIGETLEVYSEVTGNRNYEMYHVADNTRNKILLANCRIVNLNELFPTLSDTYI